MFKIAIRADGGVSVGMGHIMRCLNLALELKKAGCEVFFISRYNEGINKILCQGFDVVRIGNIDNAIITNGFDYGNEDHLELEAQEIISIIKEHNVDMLVVDSYNVNEKYLYSIKDNVRKLCYVDDINKFNYPVDILINGNITGSLYNYIKYQIDETMLLGTEYNLTRAEFRNLPPRKLNKEIKQLMITVGGADPKNSTMKILDLVVHQESLLATQINVIIGPAFNNNNNGIKNYASNYSNIVLWEDVEEMSQVMLEADIAISSGGSTLYELCACGTPTIAFILADNQQDIVEYFFKNELLISVGWFDEITDEKLKLALEDIINNYAKRVNMCESMKSLIDGYGAKRTSIKLVDSLNN